MTRLSFSGFVFELDLKKTRDINLKKKKENTEQIRINRKKIQERQQFVNKSWPC